MNNHILVLQAQQSNPMFTFLFMGGMIAVMYFFMLRPQQKRAKEQKAFSESMGAGDYIITSAGIHGTIQRVNDDGTVQVELGRGNFIKLERSAISMESTAAYRKKTNPTEVAAASTAK